MKITALIFALIIILCPYPPEITANNSFGAQQNVEGMDISKGQPNVVMQSVVFGKNGKKQLNEQSDADGTGRDENEEMEAAVRNVLQLMCPCMFKKSNNADDNDCDDTDDIENIDDFGSLRMQRLVKIFNNHNSNKKRKLKNYNERTSESKMNKRGQKFLKNQQERDSDEVAAKPSRDLRRVRFIPGRYRGQQTNSRLRSKNYLDVTEESDELKENMRTQVNSKCGRESSMWEDSDEEPGEPGGEVLWSRADHCGYRRARNQFNPGVQKHGVGHDWRRSRCNDWGGECRRTRGGPPRDILYIPRIDKPTGRRNKFPSLPGPAWPPEY